MRTPVIIVNFKAYKQGTGRNALELAKICEKVAVETGKEIAIAVEEVDIHAISSTVSIPVLSEHLDPIHAGAHTGNNLAEAVKANGAVGTILNHSEDRFRIDQLEESIKRAKEVGLLTIVCASDAKVAEAVAAFEPDMIAVEPPELIGTGVSVSKVQPEIITDTIEKVKKIADITVICGAGVMTGEDVKKAIELGSKGVLVASGIVKSEDPEKALRDLAEAL